MKTIILVRHAKAVNKEVDIADYYRPLRKKGKTESKEMVQNFIQTGLKPDLLISSPATRALDTAKIFAKELKYTIKDIKQDEVVYFANSGIKFLDVFKDIEDEKKQVMVFGHEPTMSEFAAFLIKGFSYNFPKTAVLAVDLELKSWKEIKKYMGKMRFFLLPPGKEVDQSKL